MKNTFKHLCILLITVLLLAIVPVTNYFVDPSSIFNMDVPDSDEGAAVEIMLNGHSAEGLVNYDERLVKRLCIPYKTYSETIVIASSRGALITSDMAGTGSFFNLSITGAALKDIIGIYGVFYANGGRPERVIISLDPWFLNSKYDSLRFENVLTDGYCSYLSDRMNYSEEDIPYNRSVKPIYYGKNEAQKLWDYPFSTQIELFSIPYFQSSLSSLFGNKIISVSETSEEWTVYGSLRPDGSYCYPEEYRNSGPEEIQKLAVSQTKEISKNKARIIGSEDMSFDDPNYVLFDDFLKSLYENNINTDILMSPLSPILWDYMLQHERYAPVLESAEYFRSVSEKYNFEIIGDFNPYTVDAKYTDFYDGYHYRPENVEKLVAMFERGDDN